MLIYGAVLLNIAGSRKKPEHYMKLITKLMIYNIVSYMTQELIN